MADNGRWFKLWTTAPHDPHLANLSLEDFARWCLFGTYLKVHGKNGVISITDPANSLQQIFRLKSFNDVIMSIKLFPNCDVQITQNSSVTPVTTVTVTWHNWLKYQGDFSGDRVAKFRSVKRTKKRREENKKRIRKEDITPLKSPLGFELPDWIPVEQWNDFLEMRKSIRKPLKIAGIKAAIKKLGEFKEHGEDLQKVLEQSILSSYQGLFPVKKDKKQWEDKYL